MQGSTTPPAHTAVLWKVPGEHDGLNTAELGAENK